MAKKFVVQATSTGTTAGDSYPWSSMFVYMMSILLVILTGFSVAPSIIYAAVIAVPIVLSYGARSCRLHGHDGGRQIALTVNKTFVEISTLESGTRIGHSLLINRTQIIDVVVNEIVLSHKVVSVVVLRLLKTTGPLTPFENAPVQNLLMHNNVKLQLAFPGVEMSYIDCMTMRQEICRTLDS